jgi:hypothetical protein
LIDRIAVLMTDTKGDPVRSSRAIADLLAQLGLDVKPPAPKPKTLADHLAEMASRDATEAGGASNGKALSWMRSLRKDAWTVKGTRFLATWKGAGDVRAF